MKSTNVNVINQIDIEDFSNLTLQEQVNSINAAFLSPLEEYRMLTPLERHPLEDSPEFLKVTEERVQKVLEKLNPNKASGPDKIPNWFLKEYSYVIALPIMKILNLSFYEQSIPTAWKMADVVPLQKKKRVNVLEKDLRPISLTPCVSKVAEEFIVDDYVKPAVLEMIDKTQYGSIPYSSTTMALINMLHHWYLGTDGNGSTVRTILFVYRKAFDFIDHEILINKVCKLNIPRSIINWIIDFLSNRIQRVKLPEDCYSEWGSVPSGVPQGTKLGPWLFILMIQDLDIDSPYLWKFVDDTTASELLPKGRVSKAQNIVDRVIQWSDENRVQLHPDKCKELRITFSKNPSVLDPLIVNGKEVETVDNVKLLGVTMSSDLTWNAHIEEVIKKANKRLYFLVQLKRAKVPLKELVLFYTTCVQSVIDYAIPAFYHALPKYLKKELVRLEKRAIAIMNPRTHYDVASEVLNMRLIEDHHDLLCSRLFNSMMRDVNHKLADLLPPLYSSHHDLRNERKFNVPCTFTNRARNSFVVAMAAKV